MKKKPTSSPAEPKPVEAPDDKPVVAFANPQLFERWLAKHHADHEGVWIRFFKAGSGHASVTYAEGAGTWRCAMVGSMARCAKPTRSLGFTNSHRAVNAALVAEKTSSCGAISRSRSHAACGQRPLMQPKPMAVGCCLCITRTFVESAEFMAALKKSKESRRLLCHTLPKRIATRSTIDCIQSRKQRPKQGSCLNSSQCSNAW